MEHATKVSELRLAETTDDYNAALAFYRVAGGADIAADEREARG